MGDASGACGGAARRGHTREPCCPAGAPAPTTAAGSGARPRSRSRSRSIDSLVAEVQDQTARTRLAALQQDAVARGLRIHSAPRHRATTSARRELRETRALDREDILSATRRQAERAEELSTRHELMCMTLEDRAAHVLRRQGVAQRRLRAELERADAYARSAARTARPAYSPAAKHLVFAPPSGTRPRPFQPIPSRAPRATVIQAALPGFNIRAMRTPPFQATQVRPPSPRPPWRPRAWGHSL